MAFFNRMLFMEYPSFPNPTVNNIVDSEATLNLRC